MEFLDDLIKKQDNDNQPEQKPPEVDAWNQLINGVVYEDPYEQGSTDPDKKRGLFRRNRNSQTRGRKNSITRKRKRILTSLVVSIVIIWALIFIVILSTSGNNILNLFKAPTDGTQDLDSAVISPQDFDESISGEETSKEGSSTREETVIVSDALPTPPSVPGAPFTRFDREIQENPALIDLYQLRGHEYIDKGAYEAALADFQYVLSIDNNRAEAYAGTGIVYYYVRRWNEAELALRKALTYNEELSTAYFWLGHIYYYKGEYKAAFQAYDMAAEYDRSNAAAEAWLAITSAQLGDYYETLGAVTRAMSITHDLSINFVASSWEHLLQAPPDIDGAQGDLLYARDLDPNNFITLNALAEFYLNYRPERLAEAELLAHYAQDWAKSDIERAKALHTLGQVYMAKGLNADAEKVFIQAMDLSTVDGFVVLPGLADDFNSLRQ